MQKYIEWTKDFFRDDPMVSVEEAGEYVLAIVPKCSDGYRTEVGFRDGNMIFNGSEYPVETDRKKFELILADLYCHYVYPL